MSLASAPILAAASGSQESSMHANVLAWTILAALVIGMLLVDLFVFGRGKREVTVRESLAWTIVWTLVALAFGAALWLLEGHEPASEYLAGFLLERSLGLDNLFVFAVLFSYFAVPVVVQPRVLSWGVMLALVLRLVFIVAGAAILDAFHPTYYFFGALLIYTAYKLARHDDEELIEPEHNPVLRLIRKTVPMSHDYDGTRLTTRVDGRKIATPLVAVFVVVATTDLVFAVDSVPAIFAVTTVSFIVFAANAFAMLGLRALFFLLVGVMDRFVYLTHGLAVILALIGVKMLLIDVWHAPIWASLAMIVVVLSATIFFSLRAAPRPGEHGPGEGLEELLEEPAGETA